MKKVYLLLLLVLFIYSHAVSQEIQWFYPWQNDLRKLIKVEENETLPILKNGSCFRILKISNFQGDRINGIIVFSNNVIIECYQIPVITNYTQYKILDLMLPIENNKKLNDGNRTKYFLLKFKGVQPSSENILIHISTNEKTYKLKKKIAVSKEEFVPKLDLNVWAYFDYNFLMEGVKNQVIDDLCKHHVTVLVIPNYVIPVVGNISQTKIQKLKDYLQGTQGKFKYYILYMGGFYKTENNMMTSQWKRNFPTWYHAVMQVFDELKIPAKQVMLYPIDEPAQQNIDKWISIYDYCRQIGVKNDFFITVSNRDAKEVARKSEYVQAHSGVVNLIKDVITNKKVNTILWIYETNFGSSRNNAAFSYLKMGIKASEYNASGIGIWNYADVKRASTEQDVTIFRKGKGTWEFQLSKPAYDYSLIYRKGNEIYSSIRWEALSYGLEENYWIDLHREENGIRKNKQLINKLLNNNDDHILKEWEDIKLSLIR